jgi:steroid delta-isomerase-like uncharacterized protein
MQPESGQSWSLTERSFAQRFITAWNSHDVEQIKQFYTEDYEGVDVNEPEPHYGFAGVRLNFLNYYRAFPDLQFTVETVIDDGNQLALVWHGRGTHRGKLLNIPATGRPVTIRGVSILTVDADLISKALYIWDVAGVLRSIGLLPDL